MVKSRLPSSAPRLILKRIVNFDLVVTNEAIRSLFHFAETTKDGLYFCGRAFTADKDTQTGSIEVVRLRLYDVCRGSQQSAGAIKLKGQRIGTVAMTKRIGCIADRRALQSQLAAKLGAGPHDVISGSRP